MKKIFYIGYIFLIVYINSTFAQKSNIISFTDSNYTDTVKDLIRYKQFWVVEINPKINPYQFVLNVYEKDTTSFQRITNTIISIYNNSTNKLLQIIKDTLDYSFISLGCDDGFPDINNDGYTDLPINTGSGSHGNSYFDIWIFNPTTSLFEYNKSYSNLFALYIDKSDNTFWSTTETGVDTTIQEHYKIVNDKPVCIFRIIYLTEYGKDGEEYEVTEEYKINGNEVVKVKYCKEIIIE